MPDPTAALRARFSEVVTDEADLRATTGAAHQRALDKVVRVIDDHARRFIAASPFVFIATASEDGTLDVSPKGDPAGFVQVLDERTLAIPDRPGNRRYDTFRNLMSNPSVGLIFVVPTIGYTIRVAGSGIVVRDPALIRSMAVSGREPDQALVVEVTRVLSHCPKCMVRSGLWRPEAWPDASDVPSFAETLIAHARLAEDVGEVEASIEEGIRTRLY
ncbi:MAG: MSMEG_1061 family FMN-dependent PPOX-type flavoprotein [Amaricoccus sp.]